MNRFIVLFDDKVEFFSTNEEAVAYITQMIQKAEDECDVDGYPKFIDEVYLAEISHKVEPIIAGGLGLVLVKK